MCTDLVCVDMATSICSLIFSPRKALIACKFITYVRVFGSSRTQDGISNEYAILHHLAMSEQMSS